MFRAFFVAVSLVFLALSAGPAWAGEPVEMSIKNEWSFGEARVRHLVPPAPGGIATSIPIQPVIAAAC
jgi:hypothetical protein